jgi:hypothetical protein
MPEFDHNIDLNYNYASKFSSSLSYSRIRLPLRGQTQQVDSTMITYFQMSNLDNSNELRYHIYYNNDLKKWWNFTLSLGAYYFDFQGLIDGSRVNSRGFSYSGYMSHIFLLPKNFKIELNGFYVGPWLSGGLYNFKPRGALNLALKKTMLKDKLTLTVSGYDVLFTNKSRFKVNFNNQDYYLVETYDTRRFNISVGYNFGSIKVQQREVKGKDDQRNRMGR